MTTNWYKALLLFFSLSASAGFAQENPDSDSLPEGLHPDDPIIAMMDSLLHQEYALTDKFTTDREKLNIYNFPEDSIPEYPDSVYFARLQEMNAMTPFEFEFNEDVLAYIKLYVKHRRTFTAIVLGRAEMYFPMFEQKLDKYDMPFELKYLAVVESALNPTAKSPAGAMGLWQFMKPTANMYGLEVNSFVDERRDPLLSTEAACRYLKMLHRLYDDWSMALAAYNAGPGNVNRAIRRSGGYMKYWEIRDELPRETQGYVPAFIAINYVMRYAAEHNIYPRTPDYHYYDVDTVQVDKPLELAHVSEAICIPLEQLEYLNPIYRFGHIPVTENMEGKPHVCLPVDKIGEFMANLDTLYKWGGEDTASFIAFERRQIHTVRSGEYLGYIANKYHVSVSEIQGWNDMRGTNLYPGQRLTIYTKGRKRVEREEKPKKDKEEQNKPGSTAVSSSGYYYYTIQAGDTLWDIANKKGVSLDDIKHLNSGLNEKRLKAGQRIKIPKTG